MYDKYLTVVGNTIKDFQYLFNIIAMNNISIARIDTETSAVERCLER